MFGPTPCPQVPNPRKHQEQRVAQHLKQTEECVRLRVCAYVCVQTSKSNSQCKAFAHCVFVCQCVCNSACAPVCACERLCACVSV